MASIKAILKSQFGFDDFRPGQEAIIDQVLAGQDVLGILPTGSGKTLCYQLPALVLGGVTLVIEPLLALMDDQVKRLQAFGEKRGIALTGNLKPHEFNQVLMHLDQYRFIFMSPEMLANPAVKQKLLQLPINLAVVDEAHCISQWGPDFRPDYLKLGERLRPLQPRSILALTATAPKPVQQDIVHGLGLHQPFEMITSVDRPNIYLGVEQLPTQQDKLERLVDLVQQVAGPKIIYFDRKAQAETVAQLLQQKTDQAVAFYHADLSAHERDLIQRQFMSDQLQVICATSAFGMGIDKADVRLVIHTFVPESLEDYSQAMGRAGRDGQKSAAVILIGPGDYQRAAQFVRQVPDAQLIATVFKHPSAYAQFDDPQVVLIEAYINSGFTQKQVEQQLLARQSDKQRSFAAISDLIQTKGCRRQSLLGHFDSPLVPHSDFCCGALTADVLSQLAPVVAKTQRTDDSWQNIFAQIFNSETGSGAHVVQ